MPSLFPIAVAVSGTGSNLGSLIAASRAGLLGAEIKAVVSSKADAYGLVRAKEAGIPTRVFALADYPDRQAADAAMAGYLQSLGVKALILAGYMRLVTPVILQAFEAGVLNIHPSLLPSFAGLHGQADAAAYGVTLSGCTVHFVDEELDHGPVIIQAAVPAMTDDDAESLGARILELEHRVLPQAVRWLAEGRLRIEGRKVRLLEAKGAFLGAGAPFSGGGNCLIWPALEHF